MLEDQLRVAHNCNVRFQTALDLERIDVDLDDSRARGQVAAESGLELLEAGADVEDEVCLVERPRARLRPVEADVPEGEPVCLGDRAAARGSRHDGSVEPLGQGDELRLGAREPDAAPGPDHRPLGVGEQTGGPLDSLRVTGGAKRD